MESKGVVGGETGVTSVDLSSKYRMTSRRQWGAWQDTGATCTRGRIQGQRVRVAGYSGDVYACKDPNGGSNTR
jgi:hypothetical protein